MKPEPIVWIVDDDADVGRSTEWMLKRAGFKAVAFASAVDFLESYDPGVTGCVLLDLKMPGMSGLELHQHMVEHHWMTPVIMISAHADVPTAVQAMEQGVAVPVRQSGSSVLPVSRQQARSSS